MRHSSDRPGNEDNAALFDHYAPRYADTVNASIGASGESVEYFAWLKASLMRDAFMGAAPRSLLDFGCGTGVSTRALRQLFPPETSVTGVDPSPDSIRSATEAHGSEGAVAYDLAGPEQLPYGDSTFDAIFTACVFHHIDRDEHQHWLQELRRVLRPGGSLFLFEHNPFNPLTRRAVRDCPFDEGVVLLRPRYTREALGRAGFKADRATYYFFFPSALRALRPLEALMRWLPLGAQYYVRAVA